MPQRLPRIILGEDKLQRSLSNKPSRLEEAETRKSASKKQRRAVLPRRGLDKTESPGVDILQPAELPAGCPVFSRLPASLICHVRVGLGDATVFASFLLL